MNDFTMSRDPRDQLLKYKRASASRHAKNSHNLNKKRTNTKLRIGKTAKLLCALQDSIHRKNLADNSEKDNSNTTPKSVKKTNTNLKAKAINMSLTLSVIITLGFSFYVDIDSLITNHKAKQAFVNQTNSQNEPKVAGSHDNHKDQEGKDETPRQASALSDYKVPSDNPRIIDIPKAHLKGRVLPMGTNKDGSMQAPINIYDAGWYTDSAKPGEPGAVVIDGHASGPTRQGLFAYVDTLEPGDQMVLQRGDGKNFTYEVVDKNTVKLEDINMKKAVSPYPGIDEGLNIITCTGKYDESKKTFDHRVIVYTKRLS